jgi:hypothetical protein
MWYLVVFLGHYAATNIQEIHSVKGILTSAFSLVIVAGFLFTDWRALLQRSKFRFDFKIWK